LPAPGAHWALGYDDKADARGSDMAFTITKIGMAWTAAVIAAGGAAGAVSGLATPAHRAVAAPAAKRHVAAKPAALSVRQGAKICDDLNSWVAGASHLSKPQFSSQMGSDMSEAGYSDLGSDLMGLDTNLVNLNAGALKTSPPNYYPVTGLGALTDDCASYGVIIKEP
jgi:hypothetical protein